MIGQGLAVVGVGKFVVNLGLVCACVRACVPACVRGCVRVLQFTHINIEGMSCRKQRHDSFNGVPSIKYLKKRKL